MTATTDQRVTRTISRDGTEIGYWTSGEGPPLVLVHGGLGDHTRWDALRPHLEPHATVHAMDRRGRGASGDAPDYDITREFEDVAAVVDAIAADAGSTVDVYGISFGGFCALRAASLTSNIRRLALYEGWPPVPEEIVASASLVERLEAVLSDGDREAVLEAAYRDLLGLTDDQLDELRAQRAWPARIAAAHTIPRELRLSSEAAFDPDQAAGVTVPTLLLVGSEGPDWKPEAMVEAMPDARVAVLRGQGHLADLHAPELVAAELIAFLREQL
jgi:pimeloyl-ACP methyl ester carboxylesterase